MQQSNSRIFPNGEAGQKVLEYRAYLLDHDGHIQSFEQIVCPDDAAVAAAKQLVDGNDVELWQRTRKVTTLSHKGQLKPS